MATRNLQMLGILAVWALMMFIVRPWRDGGWGESMRRTLGILLSLLAVTVIYGVWLFTA